MIGIKDRRRLPPSLDAQVNTLDQFSPVPNGVVEILNSFSRDFDTGKYQLRISFIGSGEEFAPMLVGNKQTNGKERAWKHSGLH
jgi:hypothetical protein